MAELLIKARDPIDLPVNEEKRNRCYRKGDIIVVMPDGHEWGKEERLPKFVVIKVPGMSVATAKKYIEPNEIDTGLVDRDGERIIKLVNKRKYNVLIDNIPEAVSNQLKTGVVEVSWDSVKSYVYDKAAMMTE